MTYLKELSPAQKELINEVITIAKIILVMPATNCSSERSFSALCRVKSYLLSTMTQERLNSPMILYVHKELIDKLNLEMNLYRKVSIECKFLEILVNLVHFYCSICTSLI